MAPNAEPRPRGPAQTGGRCAPAARDPKLNKPFGFDLPLRQALYPASPERQRSAAMPHHWVGGSGRAAHWPVNLAFGSLNHQELPDIVQGDEADQGAVLGNRYGATVAPLQATQHRLEHL